MSTLRSVSSGGFVALEKTGALTPGASVYLPVTQRRISHADTTETSAPASIDQTDSVITTASVAAPEKKAAEKTSAARSSHANAEPVIQKSPAESSRTSASPRYIATIEDPASAQIEERPLLGPLPPGTRLPVNERERMRVLINSMIDSAPDRETRRIVADQLEAYGLEAISLVHNHGTRIVILPDNMKIDEAFKKYHIDEDSAKDLKKDTGGMYFPLSNMIFLRQDMLNDGISAPVSSFVTRHEFAHALDDAMGDELKVESLFSKAKKGEGSALITSYAGTNKGEYFAESTAAFLSPEGEFTSEMGIGKRFLSGLSTSFSGYQPRTAEDLLQRDAPMFEKLSELFTSSTASRKTRLNRKKDAGYEAWLWRAHQLKPDDSRIRIALLEIEKGRRKGTEAVIDRQINSEYGIVEKKLIQSVKSAPQDTKGIFALLEHYWERSDRIPEGPRRNALEDQTVKVMDYYLSQKQKYYQSLPPAEAKRHSGQLFEDCDFLGNECRRRKMTRAEEHLKDIQNRIMAQKRQ